MRVLLDPPVRAAERVCSPKSNGEAHVDARTDVTIPSLGELPRNASIPSTKRGASFEEDRERTPAAMRAELAHLRVPNPPLGRANGHAMIQAEVQRLREMRRWGEETGGFLGGLTDSPRLERRLTDSPRSPRSPRISGWCPRYCRLSTDSRESPRDWWGTPPSPMITVIPYN